MEIEYKLRCIVALASDKIKLPASAKGITIKPLEDGVAEVWFLDGT